MGSVVTLPDWPEPVLTCIFKKHISLSRLTQQQKKQVWIHIKANNPALAELLVHIAESEDIQKFIEYFGVEIGISESEIPASVAKELSLTANF